MKTFADYGWKIPNILLPGENIDLEKWAVIACDQFTSQPEYWQKVTELAGSAPSTLNIIYPEAWLSQGDTRISSINETMLDYKKNVLTRHVDGFEIVWRKTESGVRIGLMVEVDLEQYDPMDGSVSLIRATEQTVPERIPPRVHIRENASLESPHVLVLVDDPGRTLIEPLAVALKDAASIYDTPLMLGGGRIRAAQVPESLHAGMLAALEGLYQNSQGLLFAVGDGNHSLATARECWLRIRDSIPADQQANHPARYALCEINNIYDPALEFEPIYRVLFGASRDHIQAAFSRWLTDHGMSLASGGACVLLADNAEMPFHAENDPNPFALFHIQLFLDEYLAENPQVRIDYVHGEDALRQLVSQGALGLLLPALKKDDLFEAVRVGGRLPRKSFSMGSATEKRYYMECRIIAAED